VARVAERLGSVAGQAEQVPQFCLLIFDNGEDEVI
jgi:hypothetical protein